MQYTNIYTYLCVFVCIYIYICIQSLCHCVSLYRIAPSCLSLLWLPIMWMPVSLSVFVVWYFVLFPVCAFRVCCYFTWDQRFIPCQSGQLVWGGRSRRGQRLVIHRCYFLWCNTSYYNYLRHIGQFSSDNSELNLNGWACVSRGGPEMHLLTTTHRIWRNSCLCFRRWGESSGCLDRQTFSKCRSDASDPWLRCFATHR